MFKFINIRFDDEELVTLCSLVDIVPSDVMGRSGAIQAAINLEIPDGNIRYFDIKIEGMNGQLPNLDLFNLVVKICNQEGVDVSFHRNVSWLWLSNLGTNC